MGDGRCEEVKVEGCMILIEIERNWTYWTDYLPNLSGYNLKQLSFTAFRTGKEDYPTNFALPLLSQIRKEALV